MAANFESSFEKFLLGEGDCIKQSPEKCPFLLDSGQQLKEKSMVITGYLGSGVFIPSLKKNEGRGIESLVICL